MNNDKNLESDAYILAWLWLLAWHLKYEEDSTFYISKLDKIHRSLMERFYDDYGNRIFDAESKSIKKLREELKGVGRID